MQNNYEKIKALKCAVIVAHPDDETLWAGGVILMNPEKEWCVVTICRKSDVDRNPRFYKALEVLSATGGMGDMDDGSGQEPLECRDVESEILSLLPEMEYDLIITHSVRGEYTRHRRHEEVAEAVLRLLESKQIITGELWMFAYQDGGGKKKPEPIENADKLVVLPEDILKSKRNVIIDVYGFNEDSWEAKIVPKEESFWVFSSIAGIREWIKERS